MPINSPYRWRNNARLDQRQWWVRCSMHFGSWFQRRLSCFCPPPGAHMFYSECSERERERARGGEREKDVQRECAWLVGVQHKVQAGCLAKSAQLMRCNRLLYKHQHARVGYISLLSRTVTGSPRHQLGRPVSGPYAVLVHACMSDWRDVATLMLSPPVWISQITFAVHLEVRKRDKGKADVFTNYASTGHCSYTFM